MTGPGFKAGDMFVYVANPGIVHQVAKVSTIVGVATARCAQSFWWQTVKMASRDGPPTCFWCALDNQGPDDPQDR